VRLPRKAAGPTAPSVRLPRKAAKILGLNRNTLRKKLADLGMQAKKKRAGREDRALDGD
jgi:hypothetical protein